MFDRCRLSLLLCVLLAVGCSEKQEAIVSGTVAVDGTPAQQGAIAFMPTDGKTYAAGADVRDGKYTVSVPYGIKTVQINIPKVVGQRRLYSSPDSPLENIWGESLPAKYNTESELQYEVKPGEHTKDFDLSTK